MLEFFRKNRQVLLVAFSIFAILSFLYGLVVPTAGRGDTMGNAVKGYAMGEKVRSNELAWAASSLDLMKKSMKVKTPRGELSVMTMELAREVAGRWDVGVFYSPIPRRPELKGYGVLMLPPQLLMEVERLASQMDEVSYAMLVREAAQQKTFVTRDQLETMKTLLGLPEIQDDYAEYRNRALADFLSVMEYLRRSIDAVHVSRPQRLRAAADRLQQASVNIVEVLADLSAEGAQKPTEAQLAEHFAKYANVDPEQDGFSIGYRVPPQVRVQYLVVSQESVKKTITITDADLYRRYKEKRSDFATTRPASPSITLSPYAVPTSLPSTQEYVPDTFEQVPAEVLAKVRDRLADDKTNAKMQEIRRRIVTVVNADWSSFRSGQGDKTSLGATYNTVEYLSALGKKLQAEFGIDTPRLEAPAQGFARTDLEAGELGRATSEEFRMSVAQAMFVLGDAFLGKEDRESIQRAGRRPLAVYQFPGLAEDMLGNLILARAATMEPAHAQGKLDNVRAQAEKDWTSLRAYEKAVQAAQGLMDALKKTPGMSLQSLANERNLKMKTTGLIVNRPGVTIEGFPIVGPDNPKFVKAVFDLVTGSIESGKAHPSAMLAMPGRKSAAIIELQDYSPMKDEGDLWNREQDAARQLQTEASYAIIADWFDGEGIKKRMQWVEAK